MYETRRKLNKNINGFVVILLLLFFLIDSVYVKSYDGQTKLMYFLIEDNNLLTLLIQ